MHKNTAKQSIKLILGNFKKLSPEKQEEFCNSLMANAKEHSARQDRVINAARCGLPQELKAQLKEDLGITRRIAGENLSLVFRDFKMARNHIDSAELMRPKNYSKLVDRLQVTLNRALKRELTA